MFLIGLGALLVLGGILYMASAPIWRGPLAARIPPGRFVTLTTARRAILGARNELAGHSPYGNRCNFVGVGGQFLTRPPYTYVATNSAAPRHQSRIDEGRMQSFK
jgi:hypothetical protein